MSHQSSTIHHPSSPAAWRAWAKSFPAHAPSDAAPYKSPFQVVNKTAEKAEILIYDQIGRDFWSGEGMAAKDFADLLKDINPKAELTVALLSPGGNVWDGTAIAGMIERWQGHTITRNDGMAASIASVILQAGKERQSNSNALVMIHKAWGMMVGNADDAAKFGLELAKYDQNIADAYAKRTGKSSAEMLQAMAAETYYTAEEAKAANLIDRILTGSAHAQNSTTASPTASQAEPAIRIPWEPVNFQQSPATPPVNQQNHNQQQPPKSMPENTPPAAAQPAANLDPNISNAIVQAIKDGFAAQNAAPAPAPGAAPLQPSNIIVGENELVKQFNAAKYDATKRAQLVQNHPIELRKELIAAQGGGVNPVFAANTVDSALANTLLANTFITTMRTKTAMLNAFTRKIEYTPLAPRDTIKVELVSSSGSVQTNPSSFETGDTTSAPISLAVDHISKSFHVSLAERNVGLALASKAPTNAKIVSEKLVAVVTALMTNANFGADNVIGAATDFDANDLRPILALGKNFDRPTLVLDGSHLSYLLPTDRTKFAFGEEGAYGFDGGLYKNNLWTGGATDIAGFVCSPDAIVWGSGPTAVLPSGEFITTENITLDCGIVVQAFTWFSRSTRSFWGSFDVCFAAAVGDATQGKVLTTQ
jgi:ATP-dependent protease ClpP protease subunit